MNGGILWANMHLLFWLSLTPFVTSWMGETNFGSWPVAAYGVALILAGAAYSVLTRVLISHHGKDSPLALAVGHDFKGNLSLFIYAVAIALAFVEPLLACTLYALVAVIWLVPDRRIEAKLAKHD